MRTSDELTAPDPRIGDFPRAGVQMHYQFAKLYLYHHVYRGLKPDSIPECFLPAAEEAHLAAVSLFELLQKDESLFASMAGRPHYVFIMFAFAGHFLLEICSMYSQHNRVAAEDIEIIEGALTALSSIQMIPQHPVNRLRRGLKQKLEAFRKKRDVGGQRGPISGQGFVDGTVPTTESGISLLDGTQTSTYDPFYSDSGQLQSMFDDFAYSDFSDFNFPDMSFKFD